MDGVTRDFSRPGKSADNASIDAFSSKFRAECLNDQWFMTLADACEKMGIVVETTTRFALAARSGTACRHLTKSRWQQRPAILT